MSQPMQLGHLSLTPPRQYIPSKVRQDRPAYRVTGTGFFNKRDTYMHPGQELYWDDEPNLNFIPLNKLAYDNMQKFLDKLDALGLKKAKAEGKEYVTLARQEWVDGEVVDKMPSPQSVFGADKSTIPDDVIR